MGISRQHLSIIPSAVDGNVPFQSPARGRGIGVAAVAVVIVLLGAAVGGSLSPKSGTDAPAQHVALAPEPTQEFVYFPAQYVNQATEVEEHIQAF